MEIWVLGGRSKASLTAGPGREEPRRSVHAKTNLCSMCYLQFPLFQYNIQVLQCAHLRHFVGVFVSCSSLEQCTISKDKDN